MTHWTRCYVSPFRLAPTGDCACIACCTARRHAEETHWYWTVRVKWAVACEKGRRYPTRGDAVNAQGSSEPQPQLCSECFAWHVTEKELAC